MQIYVSFAFAFVLVLWTLHERHVRLRNGELVESLRRQAEYWQSVLANAPEPIVVTDIDGSVVTLNSAAEQLSAWAQMDAIGIQYQRVFDRRDAVTNAALPCPLLRLASAPEPSEASSNSKICVFHRDGEERWIEERVAAVNGPGNKVMGAVIVIRDITDRRLAHAADAASRETSRSRDELIATVSHELRAPLMPILSWVALLKSGRLSQKETTRGIEVIEKNARLQAAIVSDLMDASRIMSGKLALEIAPVNVMRIVNTVLDALNASAQAKGVRIRCTPLDALRPILADKIRLQQIFWNLLTNAIKFTPAGGSIDVKFSHCDGRLVIRVIDNGEGIPAEFMPHLFEKFAQSKSTQPQHGRGLGLGLSIVRRLVEAHGGDIYAESSGKDQGATFIFSLPLPELPLTDKDVRPTPVFGMPAVDEFRTIDGSTSDRTMLATAVH
jgi:PAS domain S-box-containing protein